MLKRFLYAGVLIAFIAYGIFYIQGHTDDFKQLTTISVVALIIIATSHILLIFFNGLYIKITLLPFDRYVSIMESFRISLLTSIGNYFLPVGSGTGIKGVYLKKKHNVSYSDFAAITAGNYIVIFCFNAGFGILALLSINNVSLHGSTLAVLLFLTGLFLSTLVLALKGFHQGFVDFLSARKRIAFIGRILAKVMGGWNLIIADKKRIAYLVLVTAANTFLVMAVTAVAARSLDFHIGFAELALYSSLSSISILLNVTPGSIGIKEAIFIFTKSALGLSIAEILSISIIVNGTLFFCLIACWLVLKVFPSRAFHSMAQEELGV